MEKQLFKEVKSLFARDDKVKIYCHGGVWTGKDAAERIYVRG